MTAPAPRTPCRQILRGGLVLFPDASVAPADILIDGETIAAVGPPGLAAPDDARPVDCTDRFLIPGLVNGHTHGHAALGKGTFDRWNLEMLLAAVPALNARRTAEDYNLAARINGVEMALKGTTACWDMYGEFPMPSIDGMLAIARGYAEVGIRAVIGPMMGDRLLYSAMPGLLEAMPDDLRAHAEALGTGSAEAHLAACRAFLKRSVAEYPRVRLALGPTIPLHCTDAFMAGCRDLAAEFGVRMQMHVGETQYQAISGEARYGTSLTRHIDALGLLGPTFTIAHGVWLSDDDYRLIADRGVTVIHNPLSNTRIGVGLAPVRRMKDLGVQVGLGTDGANACDSENMFEALRWAANLSRLTRADPEQWLSVPEVLEMATAGSARALGMGERIGRIAPGWAADITALDLLNINYIPRRDPLLQMAWCENGAAVRRVMVAGETIVEDGRHLRIDLAALAREAEQALERLGRATEADRVLAGRFQEVTRQFCIGLRDQGHARCPDRQCTHVG